MKEEIKIKKTIQATSKSHRWLCGVDFKVEKFIDSGGRTRFQIVCNHNKINLISKQAIKAMANNEYVKTRNSHILCLSVASPFSEYIYNADRREVVAIAKYIVQELKI